MTAYLGGALLFIWLVAAFLLVPKLKKGNRYQTAAKYDLSNLFGYDKIKKEAETAGISLNFKEFMMIVILSASVGLIIAVLIGNLFFIAVGIFLSFMLPKFIVMKIKTRKRKNILFELPDSMKMYTSKLIDFPSLERALEMALPDFNGESRVFFEKALKGLKLNLPAEQVFKELNKEVRVKKFNDFTDKLLMANREGFHLRSIESLKETNRSLSYDVKLIKGIDLKNKQKYQKLYAMIVLAWAMPAILSTMNTGNGNVFLNTLHGQIYIVVFFIITIFCVIKGDEYLTLNLEDL
ncbi:type II secretion system F family protein [Paenibacillus agricola]|uniref:Type II secretion system protein GspF domain-containing protein n=1 Tax=Paenibacillus agricola TaxID=2716264 RepID=A0ABX0JJD8_9BACL|nr:hypothetical protein [Paenibacillus agricola]NHN34888.1 hypothetical protein [Paenibacillus agricola]